MDRVTPPLSGETLADSCAVAYQGGYYPLPLCWVRRPSESGPGFSWEFTAEEV